MLLLPKGLQLSCIFCPMWCGTELRRCPWCRPRRIALDAGKEKIEKGYGFEACSGGQYAAYAQDVRFFGTVSYKNN